MLATDKASDSTPVKPKVDTANSPDAIDQADIPDAVDAADEDEENT